MKINVAILGAGIGQKHLEGYRVLPDRFDVKIMCDLDKVRAAEVTGNDPNIRIVNDINPLTAETGLSASKYTTCQTQVFLMTV